MLCVECVYSSAGMHRRGGENGVVYINTMRWIPFLKESACFVHHVSGNGGGFEFREQMHGGFSFGGAHEEDDFDAL